jgi:hypothetical protein
MQPMVLFGGLWTRIPPLEHHAPLERKNERAVATMHRIESKPSISDNTNTITTERTPLATHQNEEATAH